MIYPISFNKGVRKQAVSWHCRRNGAIRRQLVTVKVWKGGGGSQRGLRTAEFVDNGECKKAECKGFGRGLSGSNESITRDDTVGKDE